MTSIKKSYNVNKTKQLIDLNGDTTNFNIKFSVVSKNGAPFDIVVADQTTLDNSAELDYKKANNGEMSGELKQDKNVYQNYFLVLKADQPCQCEVEIIKEEIPANIPPIEPKVQNPINSQSTGINWTFWLIIGVVVIGGGVFYFLHYKKKNEPNVSNNSKGENSESLGKLMGSYHESPKYIGSNSPQPSVASSASSPVHNNNLLQRLKRLHMDE